MELARGSIADRPWGITLATFARRGSTGQLTLLADNKRYAIAFDRGNVIAARSPMSADSLARVALTNRLATSQHIIELQRSVAAAPTRDEVELLADIAKLAPAQAMRLRLDTMIRAASRTFAVEHGEYIFEDDSCLVGRGCDVDIRAIVYHGVRMHLSDDRLAADLRQLGGSHYVLEDHASDELHRFGFCDGEWPLIATLRDGASLPELEQRHREIDPRTMHAAVYALVACGAARVLSVARAPTPPSVARATTQMTVTFTPVIGRTPTPMNIPRAGTPMNIPRTGTPMNIPRTKTNPELAAEAAERATRALKNEQVETAVLELKKAVELVPTDVDYSALLGCALFCAADDKPAAATATKKALERALHRSSTPQVAQFYLGRVERMLGRYREALGHFHAVLEVEPNHRDASAEIRVLEARLRQRN